MKINIFWFRRDLRLEDNAGLFYALKSRNPVLPLFIYDTDILNELPSRCDPRVKFIHKSLSEMNKALSNFGSGMFTLRGRPVEAWRKVIKDFEVEKVFANNDYEPYAIKRDKEIGDLLKSRSILFLTFKDQVIFEKDDVLKSDGSPYTIFTPYSKAWKQKLKTQKIHSYSTNKYFNNFLKIKSFSENSFLTLKQIGFKETSTELPSKKLNEVIIKNYNKNRDFPAANATSHLSIHLRFGTVGIRKLVKRAIKLNETWLNELIWREFFMMIIYKFPYVVNRSFKPAYDFIKWRNNEEEFKVWCKGQTGYPLVDAGMKELNSTGYMHNRMRMITASFLCKHLLIDWRWGETYFAEKLLDYDLAANNGNWQWAAGSGCDAAPYFRIFNPSLQTKKFDPDLKYIKKWIPDYDAENYVKPIVEHSFARNRALRVYKDALAKKLSKN